jgi:deoxyribonuclease-2
MKYILLSLLITFVISDSCISPSGKPVDWYVIYQLPQKETKGVLDYAYIDNNEKDFTIYPDNQNFPPTAQTYNLNKSGINYITWNDDATNGDYKPKYDERVAHSKGVLAFNEKAGFYIIHSLPRFPFHNEKTIMNVLPSNAGFFGQTFFCMTIDYATANNVLDALLNIEPLILLNNIVSKKPDVVNKINKLINKDYSNRKEFKQITISTVGGQEVELFIKGPTDTLPWDGLIPGHYRDDFYVETWTKPALLPNVCGKVKTLNILDIHIGPYDFHDVEDHSKWGVGKKKNIVCYGDLNRTQSQEKRKGSIACFKSAISSKVREFIHENQECPSKKFLELLF